MADPAASTPSSPQADQSPLRAALDSLGPAAHILDRFHHRHRNQHRRSRWWAELQALRRGVRRLLAEGRAQLLEEERVTAARLRISKRKKKRAGGAAGEERDGGGSDGEFESRARWFREVVVPKAYLAFTQLAADNQFAPLGVLLLGLLAQVNAAVSPVLGPEADDNQEASPTRAPPAAETPAKEASRTADHGVAVAREEVELPSPAGDAGGRTGDSSTPAKGTRSKPVDVLSSIPRKKRKKGRKGRDEFDNLFSSLV